MEQLNLFRPNIQVKVYKEGDKKYLALISDGWWMAYGPTAKLAAKRVVKRFWHELEALNGR